MLITSFLPISKWSEYGDWLKSQDAETLRNYFGLSVSDETVNKLIERMLSVPNRHHLLIASENGVWKGVIHIATHGKKVEFGVIVAAHSRQQGVANLMMGEAIAWARNRNYTDLFMHCISWNHPIKRLCEKYGLNPKNVLGDSEVQIKLPPPDWFTFTKEVLIKQRNFLSGGFIF